MTYHHTELSRDIASGDLVYLVLRKWRPILIGALLLALCAFAVKYAGGSKAAGGGEGEPDIGAYEEAVSAYEADRDNLSYLVTRSGDLIEEKRAYLASSILTQIDPAHVGKATATVVFRIPEGSGLTPSLLADLYAAYCAGGIDWSSLAGHFGVDAAILSELVTTCPSVTSSAFYTGDPQQGMDLSSSRDALTITVVHPDAEEAGFILDDILRQIEAEASAKAAAVGSHTPVVASRTCAYVADASIGSRVGTLLQELYQLTTNEDRLEAQKAKLKKPAATGSVSSSARLKGALKYAVLGFIGGAVVQILLCMIWYTLRGVVLSASEMNRLYGLRKLAVIPDEKAGRLLFDRLAARIDPDRKNAASADVRYRCAAEALLSDAGQSGALNSIVLAGDLAPDRLRACADHLSGALAECAGNRPVPSVLAAGEAAEDPAALKMMRDAGRVVIAAQIGRSSYRALSDILQAAEAAGADVAGSVVL